jgi:signal transduction histidine kinase
MTIRADHPEQDLHIGPWIVASPRLLRGLLDLAFAVSAVATFGQVWDPDVLFHVIWVILTLQAFLFGLRSTAVRIVIAGMLLLLYFNLTTLTPNGPRVLALDLAEWPLMVIIAVIVAVMADRLSTTGRHYAELYRKASDQLMTAQEGERRRLGMDLHDGVGQTLGALILTLDAAETDANADGGATPTRELTNLRRAQELAALTLEETRDVVFRLRPDRLAETGLVAATEMLAAGSGANVIVIADPELKVSGLLESEDEMNVYRIIQEALNNAVRHAEATKIELAFRRTSDSLVVTIADDGVGFVPAQADRVGLGLAGMRERAVVLRSHLVVRSRRGGGTTISVAVQLRAVRRARAVTAPRTRAAASR